MKVCLLLQRRFAYLGHQIAVQLKERHGIENFCGYVYLRPGYNFLKSQKDIEYSSLLLDEEIHKQYKTEKIDLKYLEYLEKEYGIPNLWPYIEIDRVIRFNQGVREYPYNTSKYNHNEIMLMVQVRARAIIKMLEEEKPDYLISSVVGGLGSYLLHEIAKKKGIKILVIATARIGERYLISQDYAYFTEVEKKFNELSNTNQKSSSYDQARELLNKFRGKPKSYQYGLDEYLNHTSRWKQMDFLKHKKLIKYLSWFFGALKDSVSHVGRKDYCYVHLRDKLKDQIKRKIRNLTFPSDIYDDVNLKEDFVFFPLHLEPEISTMLYAPFYTDQLHLIKQIARSLPLHYKLYVKEQPAMVGFRPYSFYKELKKIPNVKIINPKISSFEITPNAKLITTVTGTVGWEALFFKIPVITFGDVFYNKLSMVKKSSCAEKLPYIIKDQLENFEYNEDELINFLGCIIEESVDINLEYLWFKESDQNKKEKALRPLVDLLAKAIKN